MCENIWGTGLHKIGDRCSEWMVLQLKEGCMPKSHEGLETTVEHGGDLLPSLGLNNLCNSIREECSRALNVCCSRTVTPNVSVGGTDPESQHYGTSLGLHEEVEAFQEACSHRRPAVGSPTLLGRSFTNCLPRRTEAVLKVKGGQTN